ncbi:VOC family protein [Glycomyces sp. NPDC046736]|uniref:VOC family protein n=1 Tax=Glycomyces sp. NPDC046736 TaxID=3155615 RepID=UPI0033F7D831
MALKIANVTVNTARPSELAAWWAGVLGGEIVNDWGEYVTVGFGDGPALSFQYVENTEPGRIHIDLTTEDAEATVKRFVAAGATHVADHEAPGGAFTWTVLKDPDGNEFCIAAGGH